MTSTTEHPSWCAQEHTSSVHSRWIPSSRTGGLLVGLLQSPHGLSPVNLQVGPVDMPAADAEGMAVLMDQVGAPHVAAAIRELVELGWAVQR